MPAGLPACLLHHTGTCAGTKSWLLYHCLAAAHVPWPLHLQVQYAGHSMPVQSLALLGPQASSAASLDQAGCIHLWARASGQQQMVFAPASGAPDMQDGPDPTSLVNVPLPWYSSPVKQAAKPQVAPSAASGSFQGRGWQSMGGLLTGKQIALATAGELLPSAVLSSGSPAGAGTLLGYTCMAACSSAGRLADLLAGTADARLCLLDATAGAAASDMVAAPKRGTDPTAGIISAVCMAPDGSWAVGGTSGGHVHLLDARCGLLLHSWRAHEGMLSCVQALDGHQLLSSSLDRTAKLWDLRMMGSFMTGGSSSSGGGSGGVPGPGRGSSQAGLVRMFAHRESVEGFAIHKDCLVSRCASSIGVVALAGPEGVVRVQATGIRSSKGVREAGLLMGLSLLPLSKLMVVGSEDGYVKVCR